LILKRIPVKKEHKETYRKKEYRNRVLLYKKKKRCFYCGEKDPICLEFHHVNPSTKLDTIPNLIQNKEPWDIIKEEIKKCIVVCSNCHKKIHANSSNP
jgi:transcription elongation factor Elf1